MDKKYPKVQKPLLKSAAGLLEGGNRSKLPTRENSQLLEDRRQLMGRQTMWGGPIHTWRSSQHNKRKREEEKGGKW